MGGLCWPLKHQGADRLPVACCGGVGLPGADGVKCTWASGRTACMDPYACRAAACLSLLPPCRPCLRATRAAKRARPATPVSLVCAVCAPPSEFFEATRRAPTHVRPTLPAPRALCLQAMSTRCRAAKRGSSAARTAPAAAAWSARRFHRGTLSVSRLGWWLPVGGAPVRKGRAPTLMRPALDQEQCPMPSKAVWCCHTPRGCCHTTRS